MLKLPLSINPSRFCKGPSELYSFSYLTENKLKGAYHMAQNILLFGNKVQPHEFQPDDVAPKFQVLLINYCISQQEPPNRCL